MKPSAKKAPAKKTAPKKQPPKAPARRRIDWDSIERDWRTGKFTLRELEVKHKTDNATIARKMKADRKNDPDRWQKDLSDVVRQATNAKVMQAMVSNEVSKGQQEVSNVVQAAAEVASQVILGHRSRVRLASDVAVRMLNELDATTLRAAELEDLFVKVTEEISGPALIAAQQQFKEMMRLHNRVGSVQKLMAALKDAQVLEAQTFGLYDGKKGQGDNENLSDDELDARIKAGLEKLGL